MSKEISSKKVALTLSILTVFFFAAFYAVAWNEPTVAPPGGNVDKPLNEGITDQIKTGNLVVNALGASGVGNALLVPNGNVGIGTATPSAKLQVVGNVIADIPTASDHLATKGYVDAQVGGGGGVLVTWGRGRDAATYPAAGTGATACPAGWTEVYAGYGPFWFVWLNSAESMVTSAANAICSTNRQQYVADADSNSTRTIMACDRISDYYCNTCRVCVK